MSKNVFDLITAVVTGLEVIADGIFAYLGVTGRMDAKSATPDRSRLMPISAQ